MKYLILICIIMTLIFTAGCKSEPGELSSTEEKFEDYPIDPPFSADTIEDFSELKVGNTFGYLLRIDPTPNIYWHSSSIPSSFSILSNGDVLVCEYEEGRVWPEVNESVITKIYVLPDFRMMSLGGVRDADLPWWTA